MRCSPPGDSTAERNAARSRRHAQRQLDAVRRAAARRVRQHAARRRRRAAVAAAVAAVAAVAAAQRAHQLEEAPAAAERRRRLPRRRDEADRAHASDRFAEEARPVRAVERADGGGVLVDGEAVHPKVDGVRWLLVRLEVVLERADERRERRAPRVADEDARLVTGLALSLSLFFFAASAALMRASNCAHSSSTSEQRRSAVSGSTNCCSTS